MTKKSIIPSIKYAFRSIRRNKRRSLTLMFGIIISITIISGVLFYVDSRTETLMGKAIENVYIDAAISTGLSANETEMQEILEFSQTGNFTAGNSITENNLGLILSAELMIGTNPFGVGWEKGSSGFIAGAMVAPNSDFTLTLETFKSLLSAEGNLSVTYIFGSKAVYYDKLGLEMKEVV